MTLDQASVSRELGNMDARLDRLESDVSEIKGDMKQVLELSTKAKMGFSILAAVATTGGAIGAAIPSILRAMGGTAMVAALICMAGCASERQSVGVKTVAFDAIETPMGPVGPFNGTIKERIDEQSKSGPDMARIGESVSVVGRMAGGVPGPMGVVATLAMSALSGYLAVRNSSLGTALKQTVAGIQSAKTELPADTINRLHEKLSMAQDEKTRLIIKGLKA